MNDLLFIKSAVIFILTLLLTGRFFYKISVSCKAKHSQNRLNFNVNDLNFSYEQISYFVTKNNHYHFLVNVKPEDLFLDFVYSSTFFLKLKGTKICIKNNDKKQVLAFLSTDNFRSPLLDKFLQEGRLSQANYTNVSVYKLLQEEIQQKIINHAYNQLQIGQLGREKK